MASIKKRPNGQWRARYRDADGREHARHFSKKSHAQQWLDQVATALLTGQYVSPDAGRVTFSDFYAEWAERQVWAPGTRTAMDLAAKSVPFASLELRTLRRSHVEQWVKEMSQASTHRPKPLAASTIHTRVNNVRAVLRAAVSDRALARDPSEGVALPRRRRRDAAMLIPTTQEVGHLLLVAEPTFKPFIALCAFAGLRLGEAAAVQVSDVEFLRKRLSVSRQVQRGRGGTVEIRPPKYGSERVVYLPDELIEMLSAHVTAQGLNDLASDSPGWLFAGDTEALPPHQNTIGSRWRTTVAKAGLSGVRLHDLRHFFASGLIAAGCDVVTVQRALGHASATTTLNTYSHLWPTAEDRTRAASGDLLRDALATPADPVRTAGVPQRI